MASSVMQGKLTHVRQTTETQGQVTRGSGQITSHNAWSFRANDRAAVYKSGDGASLSDGDMVTVAGQDSQGTFQVAALRNDTTGSVHEAPATRMFVLGGLIAVVNLTGRWKNTTCAGCVDMEFAQSGRRVVGRQVRSYEPEPLRPGSNVMFQIADLLTGEISGPDPGTTLTATETETETLTDGGVTMSCTYVWTHVYQISGNNGIAGQGRMDGTTTFPGITPASCTGTLPPGVFPTFFQRPAGVRQQVFVPAP